MEVLLGFGLTIVVLGVIYAVGLQILGETNADYVDGSFGCNATSKVNCGAEYNATLDTIEAVAKVPQKLGLIVTVVVAAILIGILITFLYYKMK